MDTAERREVEMRMSREKHLRLSDEEFNTLQKRADAACLSDIMNEARKWRAFQNAIEKGFLRPKRGDG